MLFGGLQKFTVLDYPEKIAATAFTVGCNFRCPYCHNPELISTNGFDRKFELSEDYVLNFLSGRKGDLDGLCISGGEPTLQGDLISFIEKIKKMGFLVKLDTNGSNPEIIKNILECDFVDYFAVDVKTRFDKYNLVSPLPSVPSRILETISLLAKKGKEFELRTTVVPGIVDLEDFDFIIKELNRKNEAILKNVFRYSIQNFRPQKTLNEDFSEVQPYGSDILDSISFKLKKYTKRVDILD